MNVITWKRSKVIPWDLAFEGIKFIDIACHSHDPEKWEEGCPVIRFDPRLAEMLAHIGRLFGTGVPEIIEANHCHATLPAPDPAHIAGQAVDIRIPRGVNPVQFRNIVLRHVKNKRGGFGLFKNDPTRIHVDTYVAQPHRRFPKDWMELLQRA